MDRSWSSTVWTALSAAPFEADSPGELSSGTAAPAAGGSLSASMGSLRSSMIRALDFTSGSQKLRAIACNLSCALFLSFFICRFASALAFA